MKIGAILLQLAACLWVIGAPLFATRAVAADDPPDVVDNKYSDATPIVEQLDSADPQRRQQVLKERALIEPTPFVSRDGKLTVDLQVRLCNFDGIVDQRLVRLRTFNGERVGPPIRVKPGDTLCINLKNHTELDKYDPTRAEDGDGVPKDVKDKHNFPHGFSKTNLHTHGLKVSPVAPADDIFAPIDVAGYRTYEYTIPVDHPLGTFWYHPHRHGSTAMHLCNGMAGALIVDPRPKQKSIDTMLNGVRERVLVFQEVRCSLEQARIKPSITPIMIPSRREVYSDRVQPREGFEVTHRFLVNGRYLPIIEMFSDEMQRWRCIHAGIDRRLGLVVTNTNANVQLDPDALKLACIATDGMTLERIEQQTFGGLDGSNEKARQTELFSLLPGNRSDFLVQLPSGIYILQAANTDREYNNRSRTGGALPLAIVYVYARALTDRKLPTQLKDLLEKDPVLPRQLRPPTTLPVSKKRVIQFRQQKEKFEIRWKFGVYNDGKPFGEWQKFSDGYDGLQITPGTTEAWTLESEGGNHPFHIHVNPFWVINRVRTVGKGKAQFEEEELINQWHDTVLVADGDRVTIRIPFDKKLTGATVFHCHNLDHEDQGMMMRIIIDAPKGNAGTRRPAGLPRLPIRAPDWGLPDAQGRPQRLADHAGRGVVLVFVRGLGCSHCMEQLRVLAKREAALRHAGWAVVAVAPDSPAELRKALDAMPDGAQPPFAVLADPALKLFEGYGCAIGGTPWHGIFVIDRTRTVRWQHVGDEPFMDADRVLDMARDIARTDAVDSD
jgi:FtsP/CotA-like multicopper oxidase with cupredoxin domain/peroxiredoxin